MNEYSNYALSLSALINKFLENSYWSDKPPISDNRPNVDLAESNKKYNYNSEKKKDIVYPCIKRKELQLKDSVNIYHG
jgi:hypothetical protein